MMFVWGLSLVLSNRFICIALRSPSFSKHSFQRRFVKHFALDRREFLVVAASSISLKLDSDKPKGKNQDLEQLVRGAMSGAIVSSSKVLIKHPLDTITIRIQRARSSRTKLLKSDLFNDLWSGVLPPLFIGIPSGAVFFSVKDFLKIYFKHMGLPNEISTLFAVFFAQFPYWAVRNPSEVLKTRAQADTTNPDFFSLFKNGSITNISMMNLWQGYRENIIYAFPADAVKFIAYELLTSKESADHVKVSPFYGAIAGAAATAISQAITTPLDVVRTRVMLNATSELPADSRRIDEVFITRYLDELRQIYRDEGAAGLFAGLIPRIGKAVLSGFIQFGSYEFSKGSMSNIFSSK